MNRRMLVLFSAVVAHILLSCLFFFVFFGGHEGVTLVVVNAVELIFLPLCFIFEFLPDRHWPNFFVLIIADSVLWVSVVYAIATFVIRKRREKANMRLLGSR